MSATNVTRGRPSPYPKPLLDKLNALYNEYVVKTGAWKVQKYGSGQDDADLAAWVGLRWDQFETEFMAEISAMQAQFGTRIADERKRFFSWFRNKKSTGTSRLRKMQASGQAPVQPTDTPSHILPLVPATGGAKVETLPTSASTRQAKPFFLLEERRVSAKNLFEASIRSEVSKEITEIRRSRNLDKFQHPGMLSAELSRRWKALSAEEQQPWEVMAADTSEGAEFAANQEHITRNQQCFAEEVQGILCGLVGHGRYQIGNAAFMLQFAYRDANETLQCGTINVRPATTSNTFKQYDTHFFQLSEGKWREYCNQEVPVNRNVVDAPVLRLDEQGLPFFPEFDQDTATPASLKLLVEQYLQSQWLCSKSLSEGGPNAAAASASGWDNVLHSPALHMPSDLSSDLKIGNPRMASPSTLYTFIESVQTHEKRHSKAVAIFTQPGQTQTGTGNEKSAPSPSKLNSPPRSVRSPSVADPESTAGHPVDEPRTPKRKRVGEDCNSRTPKPKRAKGPESQKARVEEGDMGGVAVEGEEPRVPPAKSSAGKKNVRVPPTTEPASARRSSRRGGKSANTKTAASATNEDRASGGKSRFWVYATVPDVPTVADPPF